MATSSRAAPPKKIRRAVVLAGGGARGAYEVGVLDYILRTLSRKMRRELRFDILTGTSIGALNAAFVASSADEPSQGIKRLKRIWETARVQEVYTLSWFGLARVALRLLNGGRGVPASGPARRFASVLNGEPLERLAREQIPWQKLTDNLKAGHIEALSVTTTEVASGRTVHFLQSRDGSAPSWGGDPRKLVVPVQLQPEHAMASAAIPVLFPSVLIGNHYYCDGALRENTPVAPALRLGADRVLIVALRHIDDTAPVVAPLKAPPYPSVPLVLGKLFQGFMVDPLEFELENLAKLNALAQHADDGDDDPLHGHVDELLTQVRGAGLRHVESLLVRPSQDFSLVAGEVMRGVPQGDWGKGPVARFMRRIGRATAGKESDLLSFLFFDARYTRELIELGYQDAMRRSDELEAFFSG